MAFGGALFLAIPCATAQDRVIELLADRDSRYKMSGLRTPEITVKAGESVLLRVTARRGKTWNRDGSIHRVDSRLHPAARQRPHQGGRMESALPARNAGVSPRCSFRAGRIYSGLYRDLQ
jgi:hypothetical protein